MSKVKVLDVKYGIIITKPWSQEMYKHNDKVASEMKENIFLTLNKAYENDDEISLREIGKSICAYSFGQGFGMDEMYSEICRELDRVQNYWLNDEYPYLVSKGYVENLKEGFVGYDK